MEHPRVVARVLLRGERVHLAADRVDLEEISSAVRSSPCLLEQQVLQVVGRARVRVVFVTGADTHPDAERDGVHRRQELGDDPQTAGEDCATDPWARSVPIYS